MDCPRCGCTVRTVGRFDACRGPVQVFVDHHVVRDGTRAAIWCTGSGLETHLR